MNNRTVIWFLAAAVGAAAGEGGMQSTNAAGAAAGSIGPAHTEKVTLAGGCFWCVEAVYQQIPGVVKVRSGYTGGRVPNPTYEQVCGGGTGHAEAVEIEFDPTKTSFEKILDVFWHAHDPTQLNRQGNDVGDQYRSAIFYHSPEQKKAAEASRAALEKSEFPGGKVVTLVEPAGPFYAAEDYHQNYYRRNSGQSYCRLAIRPKLEKLKLKP